MNLLEIHYILEHPIRSALTKLLLHVRLIVMMKDTRLIIMIHSSKENSFESKL